jgi:peptidase S8 and S53, subtilisin, kexin, sedolisin
MNDRKFLFGHGELLTSELNPRKIGAPKAHPYNSMDEIVSRLTPEAITMSENIAALSSEYCPNDESVFRLILHPSYISKSYFPSFLLTKLNLRAIGSRGVKIIPQKWTKQGNPENSSTIEIFVAGKRNIIEDLQNWIKVEEFFEEFRKVESIKCLSDGDRLLGDYKSSTHFELVIHSGVFGDEYILNGLNDLAASRNIELKLDKRIYTAGLCFVPACGDTGCVDKIEKYSFLRVARPIPKIRNIIPLYRSNSFSEQIDVNITECLQENERKVAVFDAGCFIPNKLKGWVKSFVWKNTILTDEGKNHGSEVNSALLFGSIDKNSTTLTPSTTIDNYAVITKETEEEDPYLLFDVISRIKQVMEEKNYEFMNISIGPDLPIDDNEVHVWTSVLDELLSDGKKLLTVAVGNNGQYDILSGNARIQVPSDSVNAFSIGASSNHGNEPNWQRASYSAMGPGRMPGKIKPDILSFGGVIDKMFIALEPQSTEEIVGIAGTSFAAPSALRMAVILKNNFKELTPLGIKALMVHRAYRKENHNHNECGWGCISNNIDDFVICKDGEVTVLYQGVLEAGKYIKALIPFPDDPNGMVDLIATFCYTTPVDPQDPSNYTRSGLDISLRPKKSKNTSKDESRPDTKTFFESENYSTEEELRRRGLKWETVLHGEKSMRKSSLEDPFFEIHYNAREGGAKTRNAPIIPYALLVTIKAPKVIDIYEKIAEKYRMLSPIEITEPIPIQVQ